MKDIVALDNESMREMAKKLGIELVRCKVKEDPTRNDFESREKIIPFSAEMNHVLANIAKNKEKVIGLTLAELKDQKSLTRVRQTIRMINKYDLKVCIFSYAKTPYEMASLADMRSLFIILGLREHKAKEAVSGQYF